MCCCGQLGEQAGSACTSCIAYRYWSLFAGDINKHLKSFIATRPMFKRPLTLNLQPRSVCVCLCQGHDWPALWPLRWVMCCLVWRLRNNKHSALFLLHVVDLTLILWCSLSELYFLFYSFLGNQKRDIYKRNENDLRDLDLQPGLDRSCLSWFKIAIMVEYI